MLCLVCSVNRQESLSRSIKFHDAPKPRENEHGGACISESYRPLIQVLLTVDRKTSRSDFWAVTTGNWTSQSLLITGILPPSVSMVVSPIVTICIQIDNGVANLRLNGQQMNTRGIVHSCQNRRFHYQMVHFDGWGWGYNIYVRRK